MEWKQNNYRANLLGPKTRFEKLNWTELNKNQICFKQWKPIWHTQLWLVVEPPVNKAYAQVKLDHFSSRIRLNMKKHVETTTQLSNIGPP